jgi:hypothetical protein
MWALTYVSWVRTLGRLPSGRIHNHQHHLSVDAGVLLAPFQLMLRILNICSLPLSPTNYSDFTAFAVAQREPGFTRFGCKGCVCNRSFFLFRHQTSNFLLQAINRYSVSDKIP